MSTNVDWKEIKCKKTGLINNVISTDVDVSEFHSQ